MRHKIRNATLKDIRAIEEIAFNAYKQYVAVIGKKPAPMVANFLAHLNDDIMFVIEDELTEDKIRHKPIGYAIIIIKNGEYWLENIAVIPTKSKRGIGTQLIHYVEDYISKRADKYQLYTNVKMIENINWYHRIGLEETTRLVEDGFERIFFEKKLNRGSC